MKTLFTFIAFIFIASFGFGQTTIWSEDFSSYADPSGIVGPGSVNTGDYPNSNWTLDVSGSTLSATSDWFYVTNGLFSARDLDGEAVWTSKLIDITGFSNILLSVDISEYGTLEPDDYIKVYYELNGISQGLFSVNGSKSDDFGSATATHTITSGNNVRIIIKCNNDAGKEYHRFDNISVEGTPTSSNSNLSGIAKSLGWTEPQNIDYKQYSAASGLDLNNSIEVASFTIFDGNGTTDDADAVSTKLTGLSVDIDNWENIKAIAIFYSSTLASAKFKNYGEEPNLTSSTVVFTGLDAIALDNDTNYFSLYVTFKDKVTDNDNLKFTITAATADIAGSVFAAPNAGGAATDAMLDNNKLIVDADRLNFTANKPPASVIISTDFDVEVEATDANGSRDLDATNAVTLAKYSSVGANTPGTLTSVAGLTQNLVNGVHLWTDVQFDFVSTFKIEAQEANLTNVQSGDIDCENPPSGPSGLVITEVCGDYADGDNGNDNGFVEIYNPTSQTINLTNLQVRYYNSNPNAATATVDISGTGTLAPGGYIIITQNATNYQTLYGNAADYYNSGFYFNGGDDGIDLYDNSAKGGVISQFNIVGTGTPWTWNDGSDWELSSYSSDGSVKTNWNESNQSTGTPRGDSPLPIELLSFKAKQIKESIVLNWQTATETNNDYFTLERAIDAENFEVIGTVRGAGNSNIIKDYQFEDKNTSDANVLYYRLKQTDYDGTFTYSKTISVSPNQSELSVLNTYVEGDVLSISLASPTDDAINIEVYDMNGQLLVDKTVDMVKGQNNLSISVANLPQAIYLVRFSNANFIKTQKIFIR